MLAMSEFIKLIVLSNCFMLKCNKSSAESVPLAVVKFHTKASNALPESENEAEALLCENADAICPAKASEAAKIICCQSGAQLKWGRGGSAVWLSSESVWPSGDGSVVWLWSGSAWPGGASAVNCVGAPTDVAVSVAVLIKWAVDSPVKWNPVFLQSVGGHDTPSDTLRQSLRGI